MKGTLRERLNARLSPCPDRDCACLLWGGYLTSTGYGRISAGGKKLYVHRVAWELNEGPLPGGLTIDHVKDRGCNHRHCANVAHLEPVTHHENVLRGDSPAARYALRDRCARGHLLIRRGRKRRQCRECPQSVWGYPNRKAS